MKWHELGPDGNPLIGSLPSDTMTKVDAVMALLQQFTLLTGRKEELTLEPTAVTGLYDVLECARRALDWELNYREEVNGE